MKQMSSILRDSNAGFGIDVIVAVAADVRSFLDDEGRLLESSIFMGNDGAAEARADYAVVIGTGEDLFVVTLDVL
jgi:hypothetical protein